MFLQQASYTPSFGGLGLTRGSLTERAREAISFAKREATRLNHEAIATEHLLLGLVSESESLGARTIVSLGVELNDIASAVESMLKTGDRPIGGEIGFTLQATRVLELAGHEASRLGHHWFGTEHLLMGLMREGRGAAVGLLSGQGVTLHKVRTGTLRILKEQQVEQEIDWGAEA